MRISILALALCLSACASTYEAPAVTPYMAMQMDCTQLLAEERIGSEIESRNAAATVSNPGSLLVTLTLGEDADIGARGMSRQVMEQRRAALTNAIAIKQCRG